MCRVKLGEVAIEHKETLSNDKVVLRSVGLEHLIPEEIKLKRWDENKSNTFNKVFRAGHVLFGRRRAYLKKAAITDFEGVCSGDITVIEAISDKIMPALLPFVIQNDDLFNYAMSNSAGSLSPRVKWAQLKEYEFNLPNLNKQKDLSNLLWAANDVKEAYQRLIELTDELAKAQFIEMFGDVEENVYGFDIVPISEVSDEIFAGGDKPIDNSVEQDGDYVYPVYANGETNDGLLCYAKDYRVSKPAITISARGTIGFSSIRKPQFTPVVRLLTLIPNERVNIFFLKYSIDMQPLTGTGSSQGQLTLPEFKKTKTLLPPLLLQEQFGAFIQQNDKSMLDLKQSTSILENTIRALLKQ